MEMKENKSKDFQMPIWRQGTMTGYVAWHGGNILSMLDLNYEQIDIREIKKEPAGKITYEEARQEAEFWVYGRPTDIRTPWFKEGVF